MNNEEHKEMPRRRFLSIGVGTVTAVIGLGYLGVVGDFLNPPPASAQALQRVANTGDFSVGVPKLVTYEGNGIQEGVYVTNMGNGNWLALDLHCTHLQCAVNWVDAVKEYTCPCHGSVFDINGNVKSGPAPKPLIRRKIVIQDDSVLVGGELE